ncbi:MAG: XdhC family protein [Ignavibacteriaceae bacterium]|jgi:Xanthine and CO dehydrogenases maturation factor, XdhC/CoxF family|nr:MAG: putative xanthine dehydrogenase subunit A [Chlorobi bacterium OLB4]MBW7855198.1 XdhC family protein [Ignavibacteria bacterium]MEB2330239.1 XdhC family protein [Ignavibacteriaceae bacterium]OQY77882.1 MAG: hypothetical protein B6D43_05050 [Ignavibacteriales bacterium UTCHB1]
MNSLTEILDNIGENELPAALCVVVSVQGSVPRRQGAKMIVKSDGSIKGTIGGGNLERQVIKDALKVLELNEPKLFRHDLLHQHQMCCGGSVQIYIEPILQKNRIYIFGAGHTGKALAEFSVMLNFDTVVIDDRKEYLDEISNEKINKMNVPFSECINFLPFNQNTFIVIMTYSHQTDRDLLFACIRKSHAYLGMIGSKRKVEITKKMLRETGHSEDLINKIDMPMGLDIGAETPTEIALSIMAKIIRLRNQTGRISSASSGDYPEVKPKSA